MSLENELREMEDGFWRVDEDHYRNGLADDVVMVFGGMGTLDRDAALASVADAPPWEEWSYDDVHVRRLGDTGALITYRTTARRPGSDGPYEAFLTSVYRREDGRWRLVLHQQTPTG